MIELGGVHNLLFRQIIEVAIFNVLFLLFPDIPVPHWLANLRYVEKPIEWFCQLDGYADWMNYFSGPSSGYAL